MAEVVLQAAADREFSGEDGVEIHVASTGISSEERGNPIDYRAQKVLRGAGYEIPDRTAMRVTREDIENYDLILAMTEVHLASLQRLARSVPEEDRAEIVLYRSFASDADSRFGSDLDVPDPWYGSMSDFDETLETLRDATPNILLYVKDELKG